MTREERWAEVHPLPDRQGRVQQMDYVSGYILALEDALSILKDAAAELRTDPSPGQLGREVLTQAVRVRLRDMLAIAKEKLKEFRDPVVVRTIQENREVTP